MVSVEGEKLLGPNISNTNGIGQSLKSLSWRMIWSERSFKKINLASMGDKSNESQKEGRNFE